MPLFYQRRVPRTANRSSSQNDGTTRGLDPLRLSYLEDSVHKLDRVKKTNGPSDQPTKPNTKRLKESISGRVERVIHVESERGLVLCSPRPLVRSVPDIFSYNPPPFFDAVKGLEGFETAEKSEKRRKSLVRFLKKYRPDDVSLITALDSCNAASQCRLLSCPVCMRALRRWVCGQLAPIVAENPERWTCATLIPEKHRHGAGTLDQFNPQHLIDALRKAVRSYGSPNAIVFGSIDYSEEIIGNPAGGSISRVWCPELSIMSNMSPSDWKPIRVHLDKYFYRSPNIHAPIRVEVLETTNLNLLKPISYRVKATFDARFKNMFRKDQPLPQAPGSTRQRKPMRMHGKMQAELASTMARWRRKDRLVFIGLKGVKRTIVRTSPLRSKSRP